MADVLNTMPSVLEYFCKKFNTMLDCPANFSGNPNTPDIHHFIAYIEKYKSVKAIEDFQALDELGHLLTHRAHTWWQRKRRHLMTWSEALAALKSQYSHQRSSDAIYKDIFQHSFDEYYTVDDFMDDKSALFSELPEPRPDEKLQFDIMLTLLPNDKRLHILSRKIENLNDLRESLKKFSSNERCTGVEHQYLGSINNHSIFMSPLLPDLNNTTNNSNVVRVKRTEDLLAPIKEEDNERNQTNLADNSIITDAKVMTASSTENNTFQIDTDIMNQIDNIIDESQNQQGNRECIGGITHSKLPLCSSTKSPAKTQVLSEKNTSNLDVTSSCTNDHIVTTGDLSQHKDAVDASITEPSQTHSASSAEIVAQNKDTPKRKVWWTRKQKRLMKLKTRCIHCQKLHHPAEVCFKRIKHKTMNLNEFDRQGNLIDGGKPYNVNHWEAGNEQISTSHMAPHMETGNAAVGSLQQPTPKCSISHPSVSSISSTFTSMTTPPSIAPSSYSNVSTTPITCDSTRRPAINQMPFTAATGSVPIIRPYAAAPFSYPGYAMASETNTAPATSYNSPLGVNKPKCHQCGVVGFYNSMCPNCSSGYT